MVYRRRYKRPMKISGYLWHVIIRRTWSFGWCLYCGELFDGERQSGAAWDAASGDLKPNRGRDAIRRSVTCSCSAPGRPRSVPMLRSPADGVR